MAYNTWAKGYTEANASTSYAVKLEHSLPHTLPNLSKRIFPAYLKASQQWSNLLASDLPAPNTTYTAPISFASSSSSRDGDEIGNKDEAKKKWRTTLERGKLIKERIKQLGGEIARTGTDVVNARTIGAGAAQPVASRSGCTGLADAMSRDKASKKAAFEAEQISLLRSSSTINSLHLPLWTDTQSPAWAASIEPDLLEGKKLGSQPELSKEQLAYATEWKPMEKKFWTMMYKEGVNEANVHNVKVEQGIGANCSVVVSLELCLKHNLKWNKKLCQENMQVAQFGAKRRKLDQSPEAERNWYKWKVFVNGQWRTLLVDDHLPACNNPDHHMHASVVPNHQRPDLDEEEAAELEDEPIDPDLQRILDQANAWVPLAEKAYMKLHAGYAFPGSIPSIDLYNLTSWIPERVQFASSSFQRERTWRRIKEGFDRGTCLLSLGTGPSVKGGLGLVPLHAYGISDLWEEEGGRRRVRVDNPWRVGRSGDGLRGDRWVRDLRRNLREVAEEQAAHVMVLSWDELCNRFETLEINWNPQIFANMAEIHGIYKQVDHKVRPTYQLEVESQAFGADVWLLLVRHYCEDERSLRHRPAVALHVAEEGGDQHHDSWQSEDADQADFYRTPIILVKHKCMQEKAVLSLMPIIEAKGKDSIAYSVFAFSDANIQLTSTAKQFPYSTSIDSAFTERNAGGNAAVPTFMNNPQFRVEFRQPIESSVRTTQGVARVLATSASSRLPLNVKLVRQSQGRVIGMEESAVMADSGDYRRGMAKMEKDHLQAGTYTIIVSGFHAGRIGEFALEVQSTMSATLSPIPQEGAGMHSRLLKGRWSEKNAVGRPSAGAYERNPTFEVVVPNPVNIFARLQLVETPSAPINLTAYSRAQGGALGDQILSSGPYDDALHGVTLPTTAFEPGIYLLVASTYAPGYLAEFRLSVFASGPIEATAV